MVPSSIIAASSRGVSVAPATASINDSAHFGKISEGSGGSIGTSNEIGSSNRPDGPPLRVFFSMAATWRSKASDSSSSRCITQHLRHNKIDHPSDDAGRHVPRNDRAATQLDSEI